jgi:hypothetical protein
MLIRMLIEVDMPSALGALLTIAHTEKEVDEFFTDMKTRLWARIKNERF